VGIWEKNAPDRQVTKALECENPNSKWASMVETDKSKRELKEGGYEARLGDSRLRFSSKVSASLCIIPFYPCALHLCPFMPI
jgi:hypothetical protein